MAIKGKVIGGAVGTALGPLGTAIGAWIGHQFDKEAEAGAGKPPGASDDEQDREALLTVFSIYVSAANANGVIHPNERKRLLVLGRELFKTRDDAQIQLLIEQISRRGFSLENCAEAFHFVPDDFKPVLVRDILSVLYADDSLDAAELDWVQRLIHLSGSNPELWTAVSIYFHRMDTGPSRRDTHLGVLGLRPEASAADIRIAYRELAGQYHPDRLGGVNQAVRQLAEDKLKEINAAYHSLTRPDQDNGLGGHAALSAHGTLIEGAKASHGDVVVCVLCEQRNRLPDHAKIPKARCGSCFALLLLPADFLQSHRRG